MKGIVCAFEARLGRDAEIKTARASGRQFVTMSVIEGEGDEAQWLDVTAWSESVAEIAAHLTKGVELYIEGKVRLRTWENRTSLQVSASLVQPKGLIGHRKPKAPARGKKAKVDPQTPMNFADGTDARRGDEIPF